MEILTKLQILSDAAKYDVSCSSSGSTRKNSKGGLGNAAVSGICHSWSEDGRCISLFKILFSNECIYNCAYCSSKITNDVRRATFTPEEVVSLTMNFYKRNYIEGLFLSSAVYKSPDYTMELLIKTVQMLRENKFNGYIHLKGIPGADNTLINRAGLYVDRMSVNIELPSEASLQALAPQKKKESIIKPMSLIKNGIIQNKEEKMNYRKTPSFLPAGQTTQLIVGASPEPDLNILKLSEGLYKRFTMKRVYYSAYIPVFESSTLPSIQTKPPLLREHRLYQADWLLRFYGFNADELLNSNNPNFDLELDPKCFWALENIHIFPLEVNKADYTELIRVPGIGIRSAMKIVTARRMSKLDYEDLKKLGVVLKRAKYFITCKGKYYGGISINPISIKQVLLDRPESYSTQLSIFDMFPDSLVRKEASSNITGEF
ncbi:putative DNA modification/repair radical SAM protein [Serpentinicella alkaliphila]|uniref:Putative DNA modification/repair radical SAM protein n=1 Tax=Serpentinicella alkaliphila TaxID=1734049 RepID=A0A4R2TES0_9FIRM|nr:putative DNA modification/repair radical SAM protein [Serpentinicella alkaliphila]QUH26976.1 putative DNA modification/repair radical SAM protein [Serpentinicella alkaliphila]TCQ00572.1 putative DNA modification/repair radical SAM protein [Serpentinicella alkaliphila]